MYPRFWLPDGRWLLVVQGIGFHSGPQAVAVDTRTFGVDRKLSHWFEAAWPLAVSRDGTRLLASTGPGYPHERCQLNVFSTRRAIRRPLVEGACDGDWNA